MSTIFLNLFELHLYNSVLLQKLSKALVEVFNILVLTAPARITETLIFNSCASILKEYAYLSKLALLIAYIPVNGKGSKGANSLVVIIILLPLNNNGLKILFIKKAPFKFILNITY